MIRNLKFYESEVRKYCEENIAEFIDSKSRYDLLHNALSEQFKVLEDGNGNNEVVSVWE
jgi:hypothetical protein